MDAAALLDEYENQAAYTVSAALFALEWLHDGGEPLSNDWKGLVEHPALAVAS